MTEQAELKIEQKSPTAGSVTTVSLILSLMTEWSFSLNLETYLQDL
jgi:hypothetical protein